MFHRTGNISSVHLAVVMPHSFFQEKEYQKKMFSVANSFSRMEFQVNIIQILTSLNWMVKKIFFQPFLSSFLE